MYMLLGGSSCLLLAWFMYVDVPEQALEWFLLGLGLVVLHNVCVCCIIWYYRRSGNYHIRKLSYDKFSYE